MKTLLFVLAVLAATAGLGNRSQAQNYPWCAYYGGTVGENCGFSTWDQCMATIRGMGGGCEREHAICSCPSREGRAASAAARASRRAPVGKSTVTAPSGHDDVV